MARVAPEKADFAPALPISLGAATCEVVMSYKFLTPAWEANLPTTTKIVLISLADQANDSGYCWPSVQTLCKRTGLSERSVFKQLTELERLGFLTRKSRLGHSSIYVLDCGVNNHNATQTPARDAPPPLHHVHPTPAPRAPITVIEP
jgi:hypothetical protein